MPIDPPTFGEVPLNDEDSGPDATSELVEYRDLHLSLIDSAKALGEVPKQGEAAVLLSESDLNAYTLLRWCMKQVAPLEDLFLTSYNVNQDIIRAFGGLLDDGHTQRLSLAISQSVESRLPDRVAELREMWSAHKERMRVALAWNHSKVDLLEPKTDAAPVVITGSGNYSYNANTEQYVVFRDPHLHEWLRSDLERRFYETRMNDRHKVWGGSDGTS